MTAVGVLAAEKFWILDPLYQALGTLVAWFYSIVPSYGVAIALLTLAVRIITLPLTAKQARSQQQMQRLAPELKRLQAKYKHDKQKLQEETMKFYKENHANPFGGCLPVLIQAPVLIVLYRLILGLSARPEPKHIPKTSAMFEALKESGGSMMSWGIDLAQAPAKVAGSDKLPYLVLVALVVVTGYYQQRQLTARVSPENINPQMAMMTKIFPVMFGFFSFVTPAGVVVYFLVSNIWQIGQQAVLFRNQPAPETTAKDKPKDGTGKDARQVSGSKGTLGAGPPAKGKTTGGKGGKTTGTPRAAGKGGAKTGSAGKGAPTPKAGAKPGSGAKGGTGRRGGARGGPPPRGTVTKGSGKGTPGSRPSGRVTPPKRAQVSGKATAAGKGAKLGTSSSGRGAGGGGETAEVKPRWWQKLRPAEPATPAPPPSSRATAAKPKAAGPGAPRPRPKKGGGNQTPGKSNQPKADRPKAKGNQSEAKTGPDERSSTGDGAPPASSGNGQASGAPKPERSAPVAFTPPSAGNGSGNDRAKTDNSDPASAPPAPEAPASDSGPGSLAGEDVQRGDE